MAMLDRIERGSALDLPPRNLIYGAPGTGKTTAASLAQDALFIATEDGLGLLDAPCIVPSDLSEVMATLREIASGNGNGIGTIVIDSIDGMELLFNQEVCSEHGKTSMAQFPYSRGAVFAAEKFTVLLGALDFLRRKGHQIILISHATAKYIDDPTLGNYVRWTPNLGKQIFPLAEKWCDIIGYLAHERAITERGDRDGNRTVRTSQTTGSRYLHVEDNGSFVAKNRYGLAPQIEITLDQGWTAVEHAVETARAKARATKKEKAA